MRESRDMIYLDFDWLKVDEVYFLFFFFGMEKDTLLDTLHYTGDIILLGDLTRYVRHVS